MVEVTLITVSLSSNDATRSPKNVQLPLKVLRIGLLALLLGLLFGWRRPVVGRDKHDEESTPLLAHTESASQNMQDATANPKYGSTVSIENDSTSSSEEVNVDPDAQDLKEEQEHFQHVEKRLKDDGNWWTYAKGFSVSCAGLWLNKSLKYVIDLSSSALSVSVANRSPSRSSFPTSGLQRSIPFNFVWSAWGSVYCAYVCSTCSYLVSWGSSSTHSVIHKASIPFSSSWRR